MSTTHDTRYGQSVVAFDHLAEAHDRSRWSPVPGSFDAAVDAELVALARRAPARIVALGGGSGAELQPFVARGWRCSLVDGSQAMLDLARNRYPTGVQIVAGEAVGFLEDAEAGTFDIVQEVGELIGYVADPERLMTGTVRALVPGGVLVQTFADADRMRPLVEMEILAEEPDGFTFYERVTPPLIMTAFRRDAVLALQQRCGLVPLKTITGPGPRTCVVSTRSPRIN